MGEEGSGGPDPHGARPDAGFPLLPPPPPALGDVAPGRPRRGWLPVLGLVLLLVVVAAGAFVVLRDSEDGPRAEGEPAAEEPLDQDREVEHPEQWDERVAELVAFVEEHRFLSFEHPVAVELLDEVAWQEQAKIDDEELLDEDAELLEHGAGLFRAVGLAEGDLDLLESTEELGASGTVGLYSFEDEVIRVRGTALTPKIEATLVHELTHVLQDQHYDIGDRLEAVAEEDTDEESLRVLVEGDADRIEELWVDALPHAEREALDAERAEESTTAGDALSDLPASLVTFFASPYILGPGFMDILEGAKGPQGITAAFRDPPGPEEHVSDPLSYLDRDEESDVRAPEVEGEPIEDLEGDFGAVSWYLMLAERIDPVTALAAVDGWGGDELVAYRDGARTCAAIRFVGEDRTATSTMAAAITTWADAMPDAADVSVDAGAEVIDVTTCDPGVEAELLEGEGRSQETIGLLAVRSELVSQILEAGADTDQARCFSRGLIANLGYDILVSTEPSPEQKAEIQRVAIEQGAACR
jgi:hypothetical protein